jgi:hypothetical protein
MVTKIDDEIKFTVRGSLLLPLCPLVSVASGAFFRSGPASVPRVMVARNVRDGREKTGGGVNQRVLEFREGRWASSLHLFHPSAR